MVVHRVVVTVLWLACGGLLCCGYSVVGKRPKPSSRTHRKDLGSNMLNMADREALFRIRRASYQCIILNVFVSNVLILALPSYGNCYI